jgi:hypothetical protein
MSVLLCVLTRPPAGDGKVDYEEFLAATMHLGKLEREENLYRAFQVRWQPEASALSMTVLPLLLQGEQCIAAAALCMNERLHLQRWSDT